MKGINDRPFTNIAIQVPNVTRFNVRWTKEENVGMYVEFGLEQTSGDTEGGLIDGVNLRHAFRLAGYHADHSDPCRTHQHSHFTPMPFQMIGTRSGSLNISRISSRS